MPVIHRIACGRFVSPTMQPVYCFLVEHPMWLELRWTLGTWCRCCNGTMRLLAGTIRRIGNVTELRDSYSSFYLLFPHFYASKGRRVPLKNRSSHFRRLSAAPFRYSLCYSAAEAACACPHTPDCQTGRTHHKKAGRKHMRFSARSFLLGAVGTAPWII